jgi:hypothetical protein
MPASQDLLKVRAEMVPALQRPQLGGQLLHLLAARLGLL